MADCLGQGQSAERGGEVVGLGVTLHPHGIGGQADRLFVALGFEEHVVRRAGVGGVTAEIPALHPVPVSCHDGFQNVVPVGGAMEVAGAKSPPFQIAEPVEHEQRGKQVQAK